jgi:hypothetical protein
MADPSLIIKRAFPGVTDDEVDALCNVALLERQLRRLQKVV